MKYFVESLEGEVVASGDNQDRVVEKAKAARPGETLIGTGRREDGSEFGYWVGPAPTAL